MAGDGRGRQEEGLQRFNYSNTQVPRVTRIAMITCDKCCMKYIVLDTFICVSFIQCCVTGHKWMVKNKPLCIQSYNTSIVGMTNLDDHVTLQWVRATRAYIKLKKDDIWTPLKSTKNMHIIQNKTVRLFKHCRARITRYYYLHTDIVKTWVLRTIS